MHKTAWDAVDTNGEWRFVAMSKIAKVVVGVGVIVGIAAAALAGVSLASAKTVEAVNAQVTPPGPVGPDGCPMGGYGPRGSGIMAQYRDEMHAALAEALGLSVEEFEAALAEGQTPWQIAQGQGMDADAFREAVLAARADVLAQAVEDGVITQQQADWMLERMQNRPWGGFGMGYGPRGGMMGGGGWNNSGS